MAITSYSEQRKTKANQESSILEARVIANYGDPGLDEDYHFDILSRYVVVMIESCQRIPTNDKYSGMIVLVQRPKNLWIEASTIPNGNITTQQRKDADENVSVGSAGSFSTNGISRIYPAYSFGEAIKIRKLAINIQPPNDYFFYSKFANSITPYSAWHSEGSTLPYFTTDAMRNSLRLKTLVSTSVSNYYTGFLSKYQYEAFALYLALSNSALTNGMTSIFNNTWAGNPAVYNANGGYLFQAKTFITLNTLAFEDINIGNKARVATNECIPLVVTTPNSFPIPSSRSIGSIAYTPTYSPIAV
jgi:hypothetical protein